MRYAISIPKQHGSYVKWCDERWYETTRDKVFMFEKDEIDTIVEQMLNHYVYCLEIESEDGHREVKAYKTKLQREMESRLASTVIVAETQWEDNETPSAFVRRNMIWRINK